MMMVTVVRNKDNLCCGCALAVGKAMADSHPKVKESKQGKLTQKKVASSFKLMWYS